MTLGVLHRVAELATRKPGEKPEKPPLLTAAYLWRKLFPKLWAAA
ncbi:MAG: hypothetical protein R2861_13965 [Desulfobacterales bacterium]